MVNGQFFAARTATAVLTRVAVSLEYVASAKGDNLDGKAIVTSQSNDSGTRSVIHCVRMRDHRRLASVETSLPIHRAGSCRDRQCEPIHSRL